MVLQTLPKDRNPVAVGDFPGFQQSRGQCVHAGQEQNKKSRIVFTDVGFVTAPFSYTPTTRGSDRPADRESLFDDINRSSKFSFPRPAIRCAGSAG